MLVFCDGTGHMDAAGRCMGKGMGNAAAVTDDKQTRIPGLQPVIYGNLHIVELHFHTVEKGIIIGGAGGNLVQGIDHLGDAVQNTLGQHQAQITGGRVQGGGDEGICS